MAVLYCGYVQAFSAYTADDHGDTPGAATPMTLDTMVYGHLDKDDVDYFSFTVPFDGTYEFLLSLEQIEYVIWQCISASGERLAKNSDDGYIAYNGVGTANLHCPLKLTAGNWVFRIKPHFTRNHVSTGDYSFIIKTDDYSDNYQYAQRISSGNVIKGSLLNGDVDCFSFVPSVSGRYGVFSESEANRCNFSLYDNNFSLISKSAYPRGVHKLIFTYDFTQSVEYYLSASSPFEGEYTFSVELLSESSPSTAPTPVVPPTPTVKPTVPPTPTVKPTAPPTPTVKPFTMGADQYQFANSGRSFGYPSNYRIPLERYQELFAPTVAQNYYNTMSAWGGSCYGFAATSYAFEAYKLTHSSYQAGVRQTYGFSTPGSPYSSLTGLIELYHISQLLPAEQIVLAGNRDRLAALVSAVDNQDGLIICFEGSDGGHAVIAYGKESLGGTRWSLKLYDSNYPNDTSMRLIVDTSKYGSDGWIFTDSDPHVADYYNMKLHSHITFIRGAAVSNAVETAKLSKSGLGTIQIIVPGSSEITNSSGVPIENVSGAYKLVMYGILSPDDNGETYPAEHTTELWFAPDDVYTITVSDEDTEPMIVFNESESFEISAVNGAATIECSLGDNGYANVLESSPQTEIELSYTTEDTINEPITIKGEAGGIFEAVVGNDGNLIVVGDIEITIVSGGQNVVLQERPTKTIVLQIGSPYMIVDGVAKEIYPNEPGVTAVLSGDRTFVPITAIAEELGAVVAWDALTQTVTVSRGDTTIKLRINSRTVVVNGEQILSDVAPQLINERTMIPLKIVMTALACRVTWDGDTGTITIVG
jgi:hypothetical protein